MNDILLDWLITKSTCYKSTVALRNEIEALVMEEHDKGFPKFISYNRDEIESQDVIWPISWDLTQAKYEPTCGWAESVFLRLREDVRLFVNVPAGSLFIMISVKNSDIPYSVRSSKDIPSGNKLEKLLKNYVDSILKTKKEIEVLAKRIVNSKRSSEEIREIINKYSSTDEIKL